MPEERRMELFRALVRALSEALTVMLDVDRSFSRAARLAAVVLGCATVAAQLAIGPWLVGRPWEIAWLVATELLVYVVVVQALITRLLHWSRDVADWRWELVQSHATYADHRRASAGSDRPFVRIRWDAAAVARLCALTAVAAVIWPVFMVVIIVTGWWRIAAAARRWVIARIGSREAVAG